MVWKHTLMCLFHDLVTRLLDIKIEPQLLLLIWIELNLCPCYELYTYDI